MTAFFARMLRLQHVVAIVLGAGLAVSAAAQGGPPVRPGQGGGLATGQMADEATCRGLSVLLSPTDRLVDAPAPSIPGVDARAAAVIDAGTGRVLYQRNAHQRLAPASTTKIMTAILTIESGIDEQTLITSSTDARAMVGSSVMGLWPDAQVRVADLLYGLMLPSGNDAAVELAKAVGGDEQAFVARMNEKASELGLHDTHFANPHGLDDARHYSSADDLARLAAYAMRNPGFRQLAGTTDYWLAPPFEYALRNGNSLLRAYPGATGVKIGWTNSAGWTFVASAQRGTRELIVALLDTPDRDADATRLLDWAFSMTPAERQNAATPSHEAAPEATLAVPLKRGLRLLGGSCAKER